MNGESIFPVASSAGREAMNGEVAGSIPIVIPMKTRREKKSNVSCSRRTLLENTQKKLWREIRPLQSHTNTEKSEVKLDTGNLTGVPDIIWELCRV